MYILWIWTSDHKMAIDYTHWWIPSSILFYKIILVMVFQVLIFINKGYKIFQIESTNKSLLSLSHNGGFATYFLSIHINLVTRLYWIAFFCSFFLSQDETKIFAWSKLTIFNQNGQVWKKRIIILREISCHSFNLLSFQVKWKVQWQDCCKWTQGVNFNMYDCLSVK